jgi:hypothetical protein
MFRRHGSQRIASKHGTRDLPSRLFRNPAGPATYGAAGTIVGGTPAGQGTFTGVSYLQNFFSSGGPGPFTWTVTGKLPPGMAQPAPGAPRLTGTPTRAGTCAVTLKVTDSAGNHATESGSITIVR